MSDYTLYHGDCLDIFGQLEPQSVDAVICDPPFGTTACAWDSVIPFDPMWHGIKRVLRPKGACVLFGDEPYSSYLRISNIAWYKYDWVWNKSHSTGHLSSKQRPLKRHAPISVFSADAHAYSPHMRKGTPKRSNVGRDRLRDNSTTVYRTSGTLSECITDLYYPTTDLYFGCGARSASIHPTQKPLDLMCYLVRTYTAEGGTVLDFAMGSGTTGHACANTGRRFIGIEKDRAYYAIAAERIATAYAPLRHMQEVIE